MCFNPLAGIRCFLTRVRQPVYEWPSSGFNPLAGIRCFLTSGTGQARTPQKIESVSIP